MVTHTVAVPTGDDPVVLVQVAISSESRRGRLTWSEVWGSLMVHLDPAWSHAANRSTFTATHYQSTWLTAEAPHSQHVLHSRKWSGLTEEETEHLAAGYDNPTPKNGSMWDEAPPSPFLAAVPCQGGNTANATTMLANDAASYFSSGTAAKPSYEHKLQFNQTVPERDAALIAATSFDLRPGMITRICYVYGYVPFNASSANQQRETVAKLIATYTPILNSPEGIAATVSKAWKALLPQASMPSRPWLGDEMLWHAYYLRGGVSFDSFYNEYIVDQGTAYRYDFGFQGAARDPLQHMLPLIEMAPHIAKSVLRYTFKEMMPTFNSLDASKISSLPYAMEGRGLVDNGGGGWKADPQAQKYFPDDLDCYLLFAVAEYLLATKDFGFLKESTAFWNSDRTQTVLEAIQRSVTFITEEIGLGEHDLMRMLSSDWDDGYSAKNLVPAQAYNVSESVLTAGLATVALPKIAEVLETLEQNGNAAAAQSAASARKFAEQNRIAIKAAAWNGQWLRRAWLDNETGWVGDIAAKTPGIPRLGYEGVFSAQHGWAYSGGVFEGDEAALNKSLRSLLTHCRTNSTPYGFQYICGPLEKPGSGQQRRRMQFSDAPGMWPAVNYPTILGLAAVNRTQMAWEEFERNSLNHQARVSPHIWIGIWTSADSVSKDGLPSDWTYNFPDLGAYTWASPLASIRWDGGHKWDGHYTPKQPGRWKIVVDLRNVLTSSTKISLSVSSDENKTMRAGANATHTTIATSTRTLELQTAFIFGGGFRFEVFAR